MEKSQEKIFSAQNAIKRINEQIEADWIEKNYTKSIVVFLDICGIGQYFRDNNVNFNAHQKPYKKLDAELRKWGSVEVQEALDVLYGDFTVNVSILSDSIVLSIDLAIHQAFSKITMLTGAFYRAMLDLKPPFFMRGVITVGDIYHTGELVFGPALVESAKLEESVVDVFRCIIRREHLDLFDHQDELDRALIRHYFIEDNDGYYYFDYITRILDDAENMSYKDYDIGSYKSLIFRANKAINSEIRERKHSCRKCKLIKRIKCQFTQIPAIARRQAITKGKNCVLIKYYHMSIYLHNSLDKALASPDGSFEWLKEEHKKWRELKSQEEKIKI